MKKQFENGISARAISVNSLGQMVFDVRLKPVHGPITLHFDGHENIVLTSNGSEGSALLTTTGFTQILRRLKKWAS